MNVLQTNLFCIGDSSNVKALWIVYGNGQQAVLMPKTLQGQIDERGSQSCTRSSVDVGANQG